MAIAVNENDRQLTLPAWMEVDLNRLVRNFQRIRQIAAGCKVIASVKANAYGHGVVSVGRALERIGVDVLATGSLHEAILLRQSGVMAPILMFGRCLPDAYPLLLANNLIPTIHEVWQAEALIEAAGARNVDAYVKVDAGLGRLGIPIGEAEHAIESMARLPRLTVKGLYTHLPFNQLDQRDTAQNNLDRFVHLVHRLAAIGIEFEVIQAKASAGLLAELNDPFNAVCPGHALYGLEPAAFPLVRANGLEPVLKAVRTRLIQVGTPTQITASSIHGYGINTVPGRRGVIPVGQAEGLSSYGINSGQQALVGGQRVRILGISFEHAVLDLSEVDCRVGDVVTLIGDAHDDIITLEEFARWRGGSIKDALMALSGRLAEVSI